ncbi:MAG: hypothetical protein ACI906_002695 [Candidatus Latescibacterota bacterium]|jgi:hypothetical protein
MDEALEEIALGNDERPNSGLREGDISHAQVNAALHAHEKTIVFGQQNRLRGGMLLEDEKLPRFHAGHDMVKFFYGAVRQLPEYFVDALLYWGVSVTMVKSPHLLVFHHVRAHQSFHVGYTRKTLYMPEMVLKEAYDKGYDYWAISEVIIAEATPLMNYLMLLEFVQRARQRLREHYTLGRGFVRATLERLNKHLVLSADPECEFNLFYCTYEEHFYALRSGDGQDPYEWADAIFAEVLERKWAGLKLYAIRIDSGYPRYYDIDRDIVHSAAFAAAERQGLLIAPQTVADMLHDLGDVARFKVSAQIKADALIDMLIERGAPGIEGFVEMGWTEGEYWGGNYYPAAEFNARLLRYSSWPGDGQRGSVALDFRHLLNIEPIQELHALFARRENLPFRRAVRLVFRLLVLGGDMDGEQLLIERDSMLEYTSRDDKLIVGMLEVLYDHYLQLDRDTPDFARFLLLQILRKLDRHPRYHELIIAQYAELSGGQPLLVRENAREHIDYLASLVPERPTRLSYDPQRLRVRWQTFVQRREVDGSNPDLLAPLAAVLMRLDRSENYAQLVEEVRLLGGVAQRVCREIVEQIAAKDIQRQRIREAAVGLLRERAGKSAKSASGPPPKPPLLIESFHRVVDRPQPEDRLQPLIAYMRDEKLDKGQVLAALDMRGDSIVPAHRAVIELLFATA